MMISILILTIFSVVITGQIIPQQIFATTGKDIHSNDEIVPTNYQVIQGLFKQTDESFNDTTSIFDISNFGLKSHLTWENITDMLNRLNQQGDGIYKIFFLARHGEGYHNIAPGMYDSHNWTCKYQMEDGDKSKNIEWFDASLTNDGIAQISSLSTLWQHEINKMKAPIPETFYISPMTRTLQTFKLTWSNIIDINENNPIVKEYARETYGIGTESKRHPKHYIAKHWPFVTFEDGFKQQDKLWSNDKHESHQHRNFRANLLLNDIFLHDKNQIISITAHRGIIRSILKVVNHRKWNLNTGEVLPVVVKASNFSHFETPHLTKPWKKIPSYCLLKENNYFKK